jgi:hypothetical protein
VSNDTHPFEFQETVMPSDPTTPAKPTQPPLTPGRSPNRPDDLPEEGEPEPEPDQTSKG